MLFFTLISFCDGIESHYDICVCIYIEYTNWLFLISVFCVFSLIWISKEATATLRKILGLYLKCVLFSTSALASVFELFQGEEPEEPQPG